MIQPIANNDFTPAVLSRNPAFRAKCQTKAIQDHAVKDFIKYTFADIKMQVYAPFFCDMASLFGRELVYDYETGKLKNIKRYKNKQLIEVKHFYPGTKKVQEIDEYKNGKLVKMSGFAKDGKTPAWLSDTSDNADVTTFFHSDGKTFKTIQTELDGKMQIKHFDESGRWTKTEDYVDDILTEEELYFPDKKVSRTYTEGKLNRQITNFKTSPVKSFIPEGDQRKTPILNYIIDFDQDEKPVSMVINGIKSNGEIFKMGIMEYPDKDTIKLTRYKENGKELYVEFINKRTGKRTVTYTKG